MVLEGAEVERLVTRAEVGGEQVAVGAPAGQGAVGADPGVGAPQPHQAGGEVGLLAHPGHQGADLPGVGPEVLDVGVAQAGAPGQVELGERHRQHRATRGRDVVDDRGLGSLGQAHHQPGEHGHTGPGEHLLDPDRLVEHHPAGHAHHQRIGREGVVQQREDVGARPGHRAQAGHLLAQRGRRRDHHPLGRPPGGHPPPRPAVPRCPGGRRPAGGGQQHAMPCGMLAQGLGLHTAQFEVVGSDRRALGAQILGQDLANFAVADQGNLHRHQSM